MSAEKHLLYVVIDISSSRNLNICTSHQRDEYLNM